MIRWITLLFAAALLMSCAGKKTEPIVPFASEEEPGAEDLLAESEEVEEAQEEREEAQQERLVGTLALKKDPALPALFLLRGAGQRPIRIGGEEAEELQSLVGGARVELVCQLGRERECLLFDYRILATASGAYPLVGIVVEEGEDLFFETRIPLREKSAQTLRHRGGAKLYIEPEWKNNQIVGLKRFGVLRRAIDE